MEKSNKVFYQNHEYGIAEANDIEPQKEIVETATLQSPKRPRYWLWVTGAVIIGLFAGIFVWQRTWTQSETKHKAEGPAPTPDAVVPTPEQLGQIAVSLVGERAVTIDRNTTGRVAFNEARLTPVFTPYAGRVIDLLVNKG